jgi:dihydrofolate reductase
MLLQRHVTWKNSKSKQTTPMRKLVLFMHTSLDGFVCGPNGEMDWINVDEEIFDYAGDRTDHADTALYGRVTYQMMDSYWPTAADQPTATKHDIEHSRWYNKVSKVVISKTMQAANLPNTKIISENLPVEINKLKQASGKDILMFGSPSAAHALMQDNLIDDCWLFINPILLGQGIPLFKDINERMKLKLVKTNAFKSGVVCLHYEVAR